MIIILSKENLTSRYYIYPFDASFQSWFTIIWVLLTLGKTTDATFTFTENSAFNFYQTNHKRLFSRENTECQMRKIR